MDFLASLETGIGLEIVVFFQHLGGRVLQLVLLPLHYLGSELAVLALLPVYYWVVDRDRGRRLIVLVLSSQFFSQAFKALLARPRPYHVAPERIDPVSVETEYGLPSGHTILGTVVGSFGILHSTRLRGRWLWFAFILLMGLSRLVLGAHYPQDVVAGWAVGAVWFVCYLWLEQQIAVAFEKKNLGWKILTVVILLAAVLIVVILVPTGYEHKKGILAVAAAVSGCLIGFSVEKTKIEFSTDDLKARSRILRIVFGLVTLIGIYLALDFFYYAAVGESTRQWTLVPYVIRYGLVALWASAGAPWLFKKLQFL